MAMGARRAVIAGVVLALAWGGAAARGQAQPPAKAEGPKGGGFPPRTVIAVAVVIAAAAVIARRFASRAKAQRARAEHDREERAWEERDRAERARVERDREEPGSDVAGGEERGMRNARIESPDLMDGAWGDPGSGFDFRAGGDVGPVSRPPPPPPPGPAS